MLDLKEATMEEKITHYLLNELDDAQSAQVKAEIEEHQVILEETKVLLDLIESDKKLSSFSLELGDDRKRQIMSEAIESPSRVIELFKHLKFTIAIAAGLLISVLFFPEMWDDKPTQSPKNQKVETSSVQGVYSFKSSLPSGIYSFTFRNGHLAVDDIKSSNSEDFLSKASIVEGDVILGLNGKDTSKFDSSQWKNFFSDLMKEKEVVFEIERNGVKLNTRVLGSSD